VSDMSPRILIGMPAFRGTDFIRDALQSISNQDHRDFRVLISIDGGDRETAAVCSEFLSDSRFKVVVQDRRLGWAGNMNWLMSQPDYDFFCYWQHDDFTTDDYISKLLKSSAANPSAACYFSDIQWIGARTERITSPTVTGSALNRAISVFETLNGIPLRGLIRRDAIGRAGPIRQTEYQDAFEEYVWMAKLAREGNLQHVGGPTYFKRAHDDSLHAKFHDKDRLWRRAVWLEFGLGMLETILPLVSEPERQSALAVTVDRLCHPKADRFLFYDGPPIPFARDFLSKACIRFPGLAVEGAMPEVEPGASVAGGLAGRLLHQTIAWYKRGSRASIERSKFLFCFGEAGIDLLMQGWHTSAENWGIWSVGDAASLRLPVGAKPGRWKASFTFRAFGKKGTKIPIRVGLLDTSTRLTWLVPANQTARKDFSLESGSNDMILQFTFADRKSPFELGAGEDRRRLGIGLVSMELTRQE
jgi:GT2 family glycosyltransferase